MNSHKIGTSCLMTALMLAWFLALDIAGVEPGLSLLGWAGVAPFLLHPLLGRLVDAVTQKVSTDVEWAAGRQSQAVLNYLRGEMDASIRTILDSCERLKVRLLASEVDWRVSQEAAAIHCEAIRLHETIAKTSHGSQDPAGERDEFGRAVSPRQDRRAITGYVRRATGVANMQRQA